MGVLRQFRERKPARLNHPHRKGGWVVPWGKGVTGLL